MSHPVDDILRAQKRGEVRGIASICSAHPWVLKTALRGRNPVLIESTCNQVNQFGGYTGMTPWDFAALVRKLAAENNFPSGQIILGGDHLGPSPWQDEPAERAIEHAIGMIHAYVQAGFTKLHLDASMRLGDDDTSRPLDLELAAHRTALLAKSAEDAFTNVSEPTQSLRYVIGTEVPLPGGAITFEDHVHVTTVEDAQRTFDVTHAAFSETGLESAWERVIAMVVQPGIEFGDNFILDYTPDLSHDLMRYSETKPFIYEAHSTDYQTRENLRNLVRDHFAILKVGPALTYAFRQAVFTLAMMESELLPSTKCSRLIDTLDIAMQRVPDQWKKYYHGDVRELAFARKYSLSDRARYYWGGMDVQAALKKLFTNLDEAALPLSLISQYMPDIYPGIRTRAISNSPRQIVFQRIQSVVDDYSFASWESPK